MYPVDVGLGHPQCRERFDVRSGEAGVAHQTDPAQLGGKCVAQHLAEFATMVIGDDEVGLDVGTGLVHVCDDRYAVNGARFVRFQQDDPVSQIVSVTQQMSGHRRVEHRDERAIRGRQSGSAVRDGVGVDTVGPRFGGFGHAPILASGTMATHLFQMEGVSMTEPERNDTPRTGGGRHEAPDGAERHPLIDMTRDPTPGVADHARRDEDESE